ncbi:MAG: M20 family metallopeptidase [Actinomycetota bacterium]
MVDLLQRMVDLESPSRDGASQEAIGTLVADELEALGLEVERLPSEEFGDHLLARGPRRADATQLLVGHMDTVWPVGTTGERPASVEDGRLTGPGSFDMKAGLVQMLHALRSAGELGLDLPADPVVFVNTDEEVGSPDSRAHLEPLAREARRAFVLEGSFGPSGHLKVGRKGVGRYRIAVTGVSAHAGLDPASGSSAVLEMSHQIQRLFELNDLERGITVNVGTVDGGLRPNVIAPEASAEVDVRVVTAADAIEVDRALRDLTPVGDGVSVVVEGGFDRPPMEANDANMALWEQARAAGESLGLDVGHAVVGGASDGNLTSAHTPTLDGLGAVGDGAHRVDEHVVVDAMVERAALLTLLLAAPLPGDRANGASP